MESLDYRYFPISINKHSAIAAPDGSVQIVVTHADPGLPNWIDTCQHREGTMCLRWYRLHEDKPTKVPDCSVVKIKDLAIS